MSWPRMIESRGKAPKVILCTLLVVLLLVIQLSVYSGVELFKDSTLIMYKEDDAAITTVTPATQYNTSKTSEEIETIAAAAGSPSFLPSDSPTLIPSIIPTGSPYSLPSVKPTDSPTLIPSVTQTEERKQKNLPFFVFPHLNSTNQCKYKDWEDWWWKQETNDKTKLRCLVVDNNSNTNENNETVISILDRSLINHTHVIYMSEIGRYMNQMMATHRFFQAAAVCNWFGILPPNLLKKFGTAGFSAFDSVEFKETTSTTPRTQYIKDQCDLLYNKEKKKDFWFRFNIHEHIRQHQDEDTAAVIKDGKVAASKALTAYLGINVDMFHCQSCATTSTVHTNLDRKQVAIYFRGEDIFKNNINPNYGQPPLDFYRKSIQHAMNIDSNKGHPIELIFMSIDLKNPVLKYFRNDGNLDEFANATFTFEIGNSYNDVLKRLQCSDVLILGGSTMNQIIPMTNPTTMQIYYPGVKWTARGAIPDEDSWDTVLDYGRKDFVYAIEESSTYSPYEAWKNTPEQIEEMMSFRNGTIEEVKYW